MKRIKLYVLLMTVFLLILSLPVSASGAPKLVDDESLLTSDEFDEINDKLDDISYEQDLDIVIVTTDSLDGKSSTAYADDYFDEHDYGQGEDKDGILLLVSMDEREYAISTSGFAINVFDNTTLTEMENKFVPELSSGAYKQAFEDFADLCDEYLTEYEGSSDYAYSDRDYDSEYTSGSGRPSPVLYLFPAIILGCIISFIMTGQKKAMLKSVRKQTYANNYIKKSNITQKRDIFLYHNLVRTRKPREQDRNHDRGPDHDVHHSSGGHEHGGSHGHF